MHKLPITPKVESIAMEYLTLLDGDSSKSIPATYHFKDELIWLRDELDNGRAFVLKNKKRLGKRACKPYIVYLDKLIKEYREIILSKPGTKEWIDYEDKFRNLLCDEQLSFIVEYTTYTKKGKAKKHKTKFFELLVKIMGYETIQSKVFPKVIEDLEIKTCVYCNTQYAIVANSKTSLFQLDHYLPKSKFPYLCTSFYNLQPCCGSCNQIKNNTDIRFGARKEYNLSIWQSPIDTRHEDHFFFHIDDVKLTKYLLAASSHNKWLLELKYSSRACAPKEELCLLNKQEEKFHITEQYNKLLDVVEETVWKHQIYSHGYMSSLNNAFGILFPDKISQIRRLITGTYDCNDNIYKRPLTKMIQDVWDQLDGII